MDDSKNEYANQLQKTNELQDSALVIEKYKSGFLPPGDIPFEDLSSQDNVSGNVNASTPQGTPSEKKTSILGTITGGKIKKRSGLLGIFGQNKAVSVSTIQEDFSELPPNQRRKKLQSKIDELTAKISQETAARDGLMKMKTVYEANPALGDPMSIQGQLTENGNRLDKLRSDYRRYAGWLEEAEGSPASTLSIRTNGAESSPRRSSVSDEVESLSRSASDSSVNHHKNGSLVTSITSQGIVTTTTTNSSSAHSLLSSEAQFSCLQKLILKLKKKKKLKDDCPDIVPWS